MSRGLNWAPLAKSQAPSSKSQLCFGFDEIPILWDLGFGARNPLGCWYARQDSNLRPLVPEIRLRGFQLTFSNFISVPSIFKNKDLLRVELFISVSLIFVILAGLFRKC